MLSTLHVKGNTQQHTCGKVALRIKAIEQGRRFVIFNDLDIGLVRGPRRFSGKTRDRDRKMTYFENK